MRPRCYRGAGGWGLVPRWPAEPAGTYPVSRGALLGFAEGHFHAADEP